MKTQEQLSKMTDQELTLELACLVHADDFIVHGVYGTFISTDTSVSCVSIEHWSWIMPFAIEHSIGFICVGHMFNCFTTSGRLIDVFDGTPQRAVTICLILKLQGE